MYNYLVIPAIFGLILLLAINRAFVLWQKERSWRIVGTFLVYTFLCGLYLASALSLSAVWRDAVRNVLLLALIFANVFDWWELIDFLQRKDKKHIAIEQAKADAAPIEPAPPETKTLAELAQRDEPAAIVAVTPMASEESR